MTVHELSRADARRIAVRATARQPPAAWLEVDLLLPAGDIGPAV